jgi:hypothetical protein
MQVVTSKRPMVLFCSLALIFALWVTVSIAKEHTEIAGKMTITYTKQEKIDVGDTEEHIISLSQGEGTNVSTGEHTFMDGAQLVNVSFGDLVGGNGPHQGYVKLVKEDDIVFAKWKGEVTTTLSAEDTPVVTFEGSLSYINGTGQFENIQGGGSYKGGFTSKTTYTVEWEGEYSIKEVRE